MDQIKSKMAKIRGLNDDSFLVQRFVDDLELRKKTLEKSLAEIRLNLDEAEKAKRIDEVFKNNNAQFKSSEAAELKQFIIEANANIESIKQRVARYEDA